MARSMLQALSKHGRGEESRGNRGFGSNVYFRFDSSRRGRRAFRIDIQSAAGRPNGHVWIAAGVRYRMRSECEQSGKALE